MKNQLDKTFLKYINPKINLKIRIVDKFDIERIIEKPFRLNIDLSNQSLILPPVRYKSLDELSSMIQFAQDSEFFIKLGEFNVDKDLFTIDKYDLRLKASNVTLDEEGNLFIAEDPLKSLS